jgi:hypothetical protein
MEVVTEMIPMLNVLVSFFLGDWFASAPSLFHVQGATACTESSCPGTFYTAVATAWANIGYMTQADILELVNKTNFGKWAILLYLGAAIAALIGVATNSPMRNYTWFFLGPAFYSFLVGTTVQVQGVNWVVAGQPQDMTDVWRIAEVGLANTRLADTNKVRINGKNGPAGQFEVAYPMVFLDTLFSATTNTLVAFTGIRNENGGTGDTNLSQPTGGGREDGPWWLLSTLKWPMLENIVGVTARDPAIRDALVTFLSSECGDQFKESVNSGAYIAATQARGISPVESVMKGGAPYTLLQTNLDSEYIPTPRSLVTLYKERADIVGSFDKFMDKLSNDTMIKVGRGQEVTCSEFLWTVVQGLRWEAGHSYYQLIRSAPRGMTDNSFVRTLFYGWDIDSSGAGDETDKSQAFVKHLILAYMLRNELLYAPQITSVDQRYAPSEQSKSFGDAYVRTSGSKMKYTELYNAAIMMPYIQGIIAYLLIAGYPLATMLVILPGHYKGFLTWVAFFAWIKMWDVGFAVVQVIERSVWAMIGSNSSMAATSKVLIDVAEKTGGIGVQNNAAAFVGPLRPGDAAALAAIPAVCSTTALNATTCSGPGPYQQESLTWELLDKMLIVSANADLDLANGWYIYIMSALYLAVPAVTGQLVLGAKAGMAGMAKDAFQGVGNDAGGAARTGYQHAATNAALTNQGSMSQAAYAKAMRGSQAAKDSVAARNQALDAGLKSAEINQEAAAHEARAGQFRASAQGVDNAKKAGETMLPNMMPHAAPGAFVALPALEKGAALGADALGRLGQKAGVDKSPLGTFAKGFADNTGAAFKKFKDSNPYAPIAGAGGGGGGGGGASTSAAMKDWSYGMSAEALRKDQIAGAASAKASGFRTDAGWEGGKLGQVKGGKENYASALGSQAEFEAQSAVWEAKNAFASHVASSAGIAGMNAGSLSAGNKPTDFTGGGMSGLYGSKIKDGLSYSGTGFITKATANMDAGKANYGARDGEGAYTPGSIFGSYGDSQAGRLESDLFLGAGSREQVGGVVDSVREGLNDPTKLPEMAAATTGWVKEKVAAAYTIAPTGSATNHQLKIPKKP